MKKTVSRQKYGIDKEVIFRKAYKKSCGIFFLSGTNSFGGANSPIKLKIICIFCAPCPLDLLGA